MRKLIVFLSLALAAPALLADPVEEVRQAEIAFAKAFADRDVEKFGNLIAENGIFLSNLGTLRGRKATLDGWKGLLSSPEAPFSWGPDRVLVVGDVGYSHGAIYDPKGEHAGYYTSTWQRQKDGQWKVVFDGPGAPPRWPDMKVEEGFVTTPDGVKLHYRKIGQSPLTIVMPLDFAVFNEFRQLADVATVITYDPRNRARSTRAADKSTWTVQQDVKDLESVREHFKLERFVPIGYSYLGKMVAMYALEHPKRVTRLVQLGPVDMVADAHASARKQVDFTSMGAPKEVLEKAKSISESDAREKRPREHCEAQWNLIRYMLVGNPKYADRIDTSFCELENEWPINFNTHVTSIMESLKKAPLTAADVKTLTMPVLTIHGTEDRNAPYASGVEWAKSLPNARLVTVQGAGHQAWAEEPVLVFGSIRAFLRGDLPSLAKAE